jgi:hypothetical protein
VCFGMPEAILQCIELAPPLSPFLAGDIYAFDTAERDSAPKSPNLERLYFSKYIYLHIYFPMALEYMLVCINSFTHQKSKWDGSHCVCGKSTSCAISPCEVLSLAAQVYCVFTMLVAVCLFGTLLGELQVRSCRFCLSAELPPPNQ